MIKREFTVTEIIGQMDRYINYGIGTDDYMPYLDFIDSMYHLMVAGFLSDAEWTNIFAHDMELRKKYDIGYVRY